MLMICSKVISNSPEGLQHLRDVIYNHAQKWKDMWLLSLCKGNS